MEKFTFITLVFLAHAACSNRGGQAPTASDNPVITIAADTGVMPADSNIAVGDPENLTVGDPLAGVDTVSRKNPAHGQPGHRCDVPVGAETNTMPKTIGMSLCK